MQYIVIYVVTDIGATNKNRPVNVIFLTGFPWKQPDNNMQLLPSALTFVSAQG